MAAVCCFLIPATSNADLVSAGDIAFIGFNADGNDDFAIVLLANAAPGTVVHFNDNEWNGSSIIGTESAVSWTVDGTGLSAGTVVTFNSIRTSPSVSSGTLSGQTMSLSAGDTIYAFLGTDEVTPTTFLAAISNNASDYDGPTGTLTGTGLTQGTTAVLLPPNGTNLAHGGQYTAARAGAASFSDYVALIGNPSTNWSVSSTDGAQFVPFNTTSFQVTSAATPEPAGLSLMLLAAALSALCHRFRCSQSRRNR
ncbi:MAG: hypothetical protein AB7U20_08655 [Planctomycetaceae bacterium]